MLRGAAGFSLGVLGVWLMFQGFGFSVGGLRTRVRGLGNGVSRRRLNVLKERERIKQDRYIDVVQ